MNALLIRFAVPMVMTKNNVGNTGTFFFYIHAVHLDIIKVLGIRQLMH